MDPKRRPLATDRLASRRHACPFSCADEQPILGHTPIHISNRYRQFRMVKSPSGQDDFMDTFERCCAATVATGFFVLVVSVVALMVN
jgi:hypothetical protein